MKFTEQNGVYFIETFFVNARAYTQKQNAYKKHADAANGCNRNRNAASEKRDYFTPRTKTCTYHRAHYKHGYGKNPTHTILYYAQDFFMTYFFCKKSMQENF